MAEDIQTRLIEQEMKENYVDYAMSVITARALPDVYDGLKPVHRRILYTMHEMGLLSNKPTMKCARIVGEAMGKYHPHGNLAVYDSLVRMAQDFSLRYPLIKGQGNFGSTDFGPAADRYTEAKLTKLAEQMLEDLDKKTVPMGKNYDNSLEEPLLLPSKIPNLLVNGSSGIAVGMATNMPPHNIKEICQGIIATLQNPEITIGELMHYIKGPDFPTGAIITGTEGLYQAYTTGKGKIIVKAKHIIENNNIVITELPYQISKKQVIENIADLVKEKVIEGIADIRDESDKEGLRIFIKLKKDTAPEITLNQLYAHTSLKTSYSIANIALHEGQPKVLTLKALIEHYLTHRRNVIRKRTQFDLTKAEERQHIVEGLIIAITHIDPVIALIKQAADLDTARQGLIQNYNLTEKQANAILDMKLSKLTNLETKKLNEEYEELKKIVIELQAILASAERINNIIKEELQQLIENYGDERKTTISTEGENIIQTADLIEQQDIVITLTQSGYIKQLPLTEYKQQRRGGKGVIGTGTKEEDVVRDVFITNNHNTLLFFTNKGKIHWLPAYDIPEGSRYAKGKALVNVLALQQGENVSTILPIQDYNQGTLFFATKQGTVKRTELKEFSNPRKGGILAINLEEKDELISALLTDGNKEIIIASKQGQAVRFNETAVRSMGRQAGGVRGISLDTNDEVIGAEAAQTGSTILTITEQGYGKRTPVEDYRLTNRGGSGVINIKITEKNGPVAAILTTYEDDELICMTNNGQVIRIAAKDVSIIGRNTQGVRIMKVEEDKVTTVAKVGKD